MTRILVYADLRNTHSINWIEGVRRAGFEVSAVSSERLDDGSSDLSVKDPVGLVRRELVARGWNKSIRSAFDRATSSLAGAWEERLDILQIMETLSSPLRLAGQARALRGAIAQNQPDLVHALRLPYEGVVALSVVRDVPVVVSSWGQDFTRQAARDPLLRSWMRIVLPRCSGFHVDCTQDFTEGEGLGVPIRVPKLLAAGNFGIDTSLFYPDREEGTAIRVLYPRGLRDYVRHDIFLDMASAFASVPGIEFVGVGLAGDAASRRRSAQLPCGKLILTPEVSRFEFASLLRGSDYVVSPSLSDGTPNSVLEGMSCGAFILANDIPSLRLLIGHSPNAGRLLSLSDAEMWIAALQEGLKKEWHITSKHSSPGAIPVEFRRDRNVGAVRDFYTAIERQNMH